MNLPPLPDFPSQGTAEEKAEWFRLADLHARAADLEARNRAIAASESHAKAQADTAIAMNALSEAQKIAAETVRAPVEQHPDSIAAQDRQTAAMNSLAAAVEKSAGPGGSISGVPVPVLIELIQAFASMLSAKA